MKIVIAPDSFKESLSAKEVAQAIKAGFKTIFPSTDYQLLPVGDGGEGTVDALISSLNLEVAYHEVTGPFGDKLNARYAFNERLAVFEMADIVGLATIPREKRHPLEITTKGIGELIVYLSRKGVDEIMVAVGGSASHDAGIGMAEGLGYKFFDRKGDIVPAIGANLAIIDTIDDTETVDLSKVKVSIITDVTNPLCGNQGATYIFSKQKGLPESKFEEVDLAINHLYKKLDANLINVLGAGAGGGMAAGLVHFAGGTIISGIDKILDVIQFDQKVADADLVIVGEGRMDRQSLSGKAPIGVAKRTPEGIPVIAICGALSDDLPDFPIEEGIIAAFPIISKVDTLDHTLENATTNLYRTSQNIASIIATYKKH